MDVPEAVSSVRRLPTFSDRIVVDLYDSTTIWNRAAMANGGPLPELGDVALASVHAFHNLAMNGGVEHALESLSREQLDAAARGYRYFGMQLVGDFVEQNMAVRTAEPQSVLDELDDEYDQLLPDDNQIYERFSAALSLRPQDFAPAYSSP